MVRQQIRTVMFPSSLRSITMCVCGVCVCVDITVLSDYHVHVFSTAKLLRHYDVHYYPSFFYTWYTVTRRVLSSCL